MDGKKKEPWRIVLALLSVAYVVFLWVKKDLLSVYAAAPKEQVLPVMATTAAVTLVKVLLIAAAVGIIRWIAGKYKKK